MNNSIRLRFKTILKRPARLAGLTAAALLAGLATNRAGASDGRGEFGGDLGFLKSCYTAPAHPEESNHYLDLWNRTSLPALARANGLTNNRALFIDSHGRGGVAFLGRRFAFHPHRDAFPDEAKTPLYSARDLARTLGPAATNIHNIVVGACNVEGHLDLSELRRHFINATNIVHLPAGKLGFKPLFYAAIVNPASANTGQYAIPTLTAGGWTAYHLSKEPASGALRTSPYVATLFHPGQATPFRVQIAGRELLEPASRQP
ncbi:MAG TPA: hypothetical protein VNO52_12075 [Methylomirabilota bacterium]|nr:hypothetical protein [Methylomirabilota bacterium]